MEWEAAEWTAGVTKIDLSTEQQIGRSHALMQIYTWTRASLCNEEVQAVKRVQNHSAHYYETAPLSTHRRFSFHILASEG